MQKPSFDIITATHGGPRIPTDAEMERSLSTATAEGFDRIASAADFLMISPLGSRLFVGVGRRAMKTGKAAITAGKGVVRAGRSAVSLAHDAGRFMDDARSLRTMYDLPAGYSSLHPQPALLGSRPWPNPMNSKVPVSNHFVGEGRYGMSRTAGAEGRFLMGVERSRQELVEGATSSFISRYKNLYARTSGSAAGRHIETASKIALRTKMPPKRFLAYGGLALAGAMLTGRHKPIGPPEEEGFSKIALTRDFVATSPYLNRGSRLPDPTAYGEMGLAVANARGAYL